MCINATESTRLTCASLACHSECERRNSRLLVGNHQLSFFAHTQNDRGEIGMTLDYRFVFIILYTLDGYP